MLVFKLSANATEMVFTYLTHITYLGVFVMKNYIFKFPMLVARRYFKLGEKIHSLYKYVTSFRTNTLHQNSNKQIK